jgi:hypothetical protein
MLRNVGRLFAYGFALLALAGLAASVVVHVAALGGVDLLGEGPARIMALHAGVFVVFLPMFFVAVAEKLVGWHRFSLGGRRVTLAAGLLFAYALGNFFWCVHRMKTQDALARDAEKPSAQVGVGDPLTARAFSGHWMLFYFVPLVFFGRRALGVAR